MKHSKVFKTCLAILAINICTLHAGTKIQGKKDGSGTPKYVFVFIGDGMSYPQIQSAAYYAGKDAAGIVDVIKKIRKHRGQSFNEKLKFLRFPNSRFSKHL